MSTQHILHKHRHSYTHTHTHTSLHFTSEYVSHSFFESWRKVAFANIKLNEIFKNEEKKKRKRQHNGNVDVDDDDDNDEHTILLQNCTSRLLLKAFFIKQLFSLSLYFTYATHSFLLQRTHIRTCVCVYTTYSDIYKSREQFYIEIHSNVKCWNKSNFFVQWKLTFHKRDIQFKWFFWWMSTAMVKMWK